MADDHTERSEPSAENPKYDQAFFLALAAKGKDEWNKWRRHPANKDVQVTFAEVDFSEAPKDKINFEGFEFGHCADFSSCIWRFNWALDWPKVKAFVPGLACFTSATFGVHTKFESNGTAFGWAPSQLR
jgi:hypothetical protein